MLLRLTSSAVLAATAIGSVAETWQKADATLEQTKEKFSVVHKHADAVAAEEARILASSKQALAASADELKRSADAYKASEDSLVAPPAATAVEPVLAESSFLEIPEGFAKFPGVADDMKKVREAERVYKEKMQKLHEKDDELMALARSSFQDSKSAASLVNTLRAETNHVRGSSSFLQTGKVNPAFERILKAEDALRAVNKQLAKDFNFE